MIGGLADVMTETGGSGWLRSRKQYVSFTHHFLSALIGGTVSGNDFVWQI